MSFAFKPHQVVEVSASANPKDVIGAIVNSSGPSKPASNPNRWFQLSFVFIVIFAIVLWFREEIYTVTKDVQKHPILAGIESLQIHKYLGSEWAFGSSKDADGEEVDVAFEVIETIASNETAAFERAEVSSVPSNVTEAAVRMLLRATRAATKAR